jgi:hypothetical protein
MGDYGERGRWRNAWIHNGRLEWKSHFFFLETGNESA